MNTQVDNDSVLRLWGVCSEVYLQHGRRLSLPKGTDPAKTYQWRYLVRISQRLREWGFDDDASRRLIEIAVGHAQQQRLMAKGLSVLCQGNLLALCHRQLQQEHLGTLDVLAELRHTRDWLAQRGAATPAVLLRRASSRGYCNLVNWYRQRHLTDLYLALSRSCGRALTQLGKQSESEREQLPDPAALYLLRQQFHHDEHRSREARTILGDDWK